MLPLCDVCRFNRAAWQVEWVNGPVEFLCEPDRPSPEVLADSSKVVFFIQLRYTDFMTEGDI